jgi:hypothetical protein
MHIHNYPRPRNRHTSYTLSTHLDIIAISRERLATDRESPQRKAHATIIGGERPNLDTPFIYLDR